MHRTKLVAFLFVLTSALSAAPRADHLVSPAELRSELSAKDALREEQVRKVTNFLDRESLKVEAAGLDPSEVKAAVAALDDATLAELSERTAAIETEVSAGALTNQQLTYIVIALAAAVIVLVLA